MTAAKHTLLVVDDEPNIVQSVRDLLRQEYNVLGATSAAEAMTIMQREPVHVVMSDQRMPDKTGAEFLHQVRESYPDTVRLLFTAYADLDAVTEAINEGHIFGYLTKPWKTADLRALLRQATDHCDLTAERKRLLEELQQKNQELQEANRRLLHANELKKNFMKVAGHELRTPLTIIYGLADLSRSADDLGLSVTNLQDRIYHGCKRLTQRVNQIMEMLWAEQFDRLLQKYPVDLAGLLQESVVEVSAFAEQRHQTLESEIAPDLGTIQADPQKLRDAVEQLLINAVKFTPNEGTIRLSARRTEAAMVEIIVSDTGVGIDAADLPRIFDPFFTRSDVSRHSSGEFEFDRCGLGLGLSVVKAFVDMHGGNISAESEPGKGTTMTIVLPG